MGELWHKARQFIGIILLVVIARISFYILSIYLTGGDVTDFALVFDPLSLNISFTGADFGTIRGVTLFMGWLVPAIAAVTISRFCGWEYMLYGALAMTVYGVVAFISELQLIIPSKVFGEPGPAHYLLMTFTIMVSVVVFNIALRGKPPCRIR